MRARLCAVSTPDPALREALEELSGYLDDHLAPLLVVDSLRTLLAYSPEVAGEQLRLWAIEQFRLHGHELTFSDLCFHALKKVQQLAELDELPRERLAAFVEGLAGYLLTRSPAEERARLNDLVARLSESVAPASGRPAAIARPTAPVGPAAVALPAAPATPLSPEEVLRLRRFSLLLERAGAPSAGGEAARLAVAPQLLVTAAREAGNAEELQGRLAALRAAGVGPAVERDLIHLLAANVPDWVVHQAGRVEPAKSSAAEAVERVVALAGDRARGAERWKELLRAAATEFNRGASGRALTLLELASRMAKAGEVDARVAEVALARAHEGFEVAALLSAASVEEHRPVLRRLLELLPGFAVRDLLDELTFQPDAKRRRLLLTLLELRGAEARPAVVERLGVAIAEGARDPKAWWYWRNLVFLLHRLPRGRDSDARQELDLVAPFSDLSSPPSFARETFVLLSQLPGELGVPLLIERLHEAERALEAANAPHSAAEMERLLSGLAAALAKSGSASARRALVDHALAQKPRSGDAMARLRELAAFDLAGDRPLLARLLEALQRRTPRKLLGIVVKGDELALAHLVRALASTSAPEARRQLAELASRFPETEFGRLAGGAAVPAAVEPEAEESPVVPPPAPAPARAALSGDLEVFGLPGLLQNLQQSEASGRLLLRDAKGAISGEIRLARGFFANCQAGRLSGETAFYQLCEHPVPGTFEFLRGEVPTEGTRLREIMGLLMEAMRRYDEFSRARALVPDDTPLAAGAAKPTAPQDESDGELVRQVWTLARAGATPRDCEEKVSADSYRVRALLAHWLVEGALLISPPGAAASEGS